MAAKTTTSSTVEPSTSDGQLFEFVKQTVENMAKEQHQKMLEEVKNLQQSSNAQAQEFLRDQAEKIRNQVLTALALFAAFFSLISSASLVLIKSPSPASILVVIAALAIILLVFLSLFFVFLNEKMPSLRVLWLPITFFLIFVVVVLFGTSQRWSGESLTNRGISQQSAPSK